LAAIDGTGSTPLVVLAHLAQALTSLVQVANKLPFIVLAADDAFLCAEEAWGEHAVARTRMLRRSVLVVSQTSKTLEQLRLRSLLVRVYSLILAIIFRMEQQSFQAERLALESAILNIVIRRCVVHQIFDRCLRLVTVQDCLGRSNRLLLLLPWGFICALLRALDQGSFRVSTLLSLLATSGERLMVSDIALA